jgi:uncharacterized membrane protein YhaH (DUF805 family)
MNDLNPYTAPKVDVLQGTAAAPALSWQHMLFSFEGRIRRGQYWGYTFIAWLALVLPMIGVGVMIGLFGAKDGGSTANTVGVVAMVVLYLPFIWTATALQAKRWHDRDKSAWWILLGLVPIANIWSAIEVGFLPGTPGRNSYGPPPS